MITYYFDENVRSLIQAPGDQSPVRPQTWVYGDNYNLAVYIVAGGQYLPIAPTDTLTAILYQPQANLPEQQLAIVGTPTQADDVNGNDYFSININLATTQLAALVQATNTPAVCQFHFVFNPADLERFSESADVQTTVNPDPTQGATGGTPVPPGYPANSNVFQLISAKATPNGYAGLDATGKVPAAQLPTSTAGGDMLKSVYDTNNNGIVDTCDTLVSSRVTGLGTAAVVNVPATGNATATQAVLGSDTRLTDTRTPISHQTTHNGGTDAIPLATTAAQGLCPPVDGTTVQVVSGKLTATTSGNGDMLKSVFVTGSPTNANAVDNTLAVQTHQVPATGNASGAQLVIATDTRLGDARTPQLHQATHVPGGSDPIPLVTTAAAGLCVPPDGTSIQIVGGKLAASGGIGQHGARITFFNGTQSIPTGAYTVLNNFTAKSWDTDSYVTGAGPWTGITIPVAQYGFYQVDVLVMFATNSTAGTARVIQLWLGSSIVSEGSIPPQAAGSIYQYLKLTALLWISSNTPVGASGAGTWPTSGALTVQVYQDSGAPMTVGASGQTLDGTYLSILRIS